MLKSCVASLCWKKRKWGEEKLRERFHTAVYIEKNNLTGNVFYRFHSPNYTDFPLQSAPSFFPSPLQVLLSASWISAFYSLLAVTLMSVHPLGGFSLFAQIRYCILGVICQVLFTVGFHCRFSHWWSQSRMCFLTQTQLFLQPLGILSVRVASVGPILLCWLFVCGVWFQ